MGNQANAKRVGEPRAKVRLKNRIAEVRIRAGRRNGKLKVSREKRIGRNERRSFASVNQAVNARI